MVGKGTADRTVDIQDGGGGGGAGGLTDAELRASAVPVTTQEPISVDDNGASLTVDGTVAVSNFPATQPVSGTVDTELPPAAVLAENTPNPTVPGVAAFGMVFSGTNWERMSGSTAGVNVLGPLTDEALRANPVTVNTLGSNTKVVGAANDGVPPNDSPVLIAGQDGTNVQTLKTDTNGELQVDVLTSPGLTDAQLRAVAVPISGTVTANLGTIDGAATETTLATRLSESDYDTKTGSLTETAPATDTASSGLNGRLQRIAQRLTSLIALLPTTLGQKTKAASLAVTLASDSDALPVTHPTGTLANGAETAVTTSAVQVLASNSSRRGAIIQNVGTGNIRVGITGVTATTGTRLLPMGHLRLSMPYCPTSAIFAIAEAATPTSTVLAQEST